MTEWYEKVWEQDQNGGRGWLEDTKLELLTPNELCGEKTIHTTIIPFILQIVSHLIKEKQKQRIEILDVGCGCGHLFAYLKKILIEPFMYTGVDVTKQYIDRGQEYFKDNENFKLMYGDINTLPFPDGNFDIVVCCGLLQHLPGSIEKSVGELKRVAKKYVYIVGFFSDNNKIHTIIKKDHVINHYSVDTYLKAFGRYKHFRFLWTETKTKVFDAMYHVLEVEK